MKRKTLNHEYFGVVKEHLGGSESRAWEWFKTAHPRLNQFSPLGMIRLGKEHKVIELIQKEFK